MADIPLHPGETLLGKWTLTYRPPGGERHAGSLFVTDQRILFHCQPGLGSTLSELLRPNDRIISIERSDVTNVERRRRALLINRVLVTLADGSVHVFDHGVMPVRGILKALGRAA
jgi:hypothetical protein